MKSQGMPVVSIIVPVYNAEKTLNKCVDSILNQTFQDWELLLIDDGSTDRSGELCNEYAAKDQRIKVFHKKNGGVSSARNIGLDHAKGQWVTFVDCDDWIVDSALDIDYDETNEDLLLFSFYSISLGKKQLKKLDQCVLSNKDELHSFCKELLVCTILRSPWSKMFKREIIGRTRFDEYIKVGEDTLFMLDYLKEIQTCRVFDNVFYVYNECSMPSKYKLSIEEAVYTMEKLFQSYDMLAITNELVEKYIFLDYKLYCYKDICERHNLWFNNALVCKYYNRVKKYFGVNYRIRYHLLSYNIVFKLVMFYKNMRLKLISIF